MRSRSTLEAVGPALKQGQELLATHAKPALEKVKPALERAVSFGKVRSGWVGGWAAGWVGCEGERCREQALTRACHSPFLHLFIEVCSVACYAPEFGEWRGEACGLLGVQAGRAAHTAEAPRFIPSDG